MAVVNLSALGPGRREFIARVEAEGGAGINSCYQCGKCSAGCPISFAMDLQPRQVIRLVQLGAKDRVLRSSTIWLCAGCYTCTTRCPRGVEIAATMDALRIIARREGYLPAERSVASFHDIFLGSVEANGRLHEVGLIVRHKLATGNLWQDVDSGLKMFARGKLRLLPHRLRDSAAVRRMFARAREIEGTGGTRR